jgi:uncharacterized phage-associated protein
MAPIHSEAPTLGKENPLSMNRPKFNERKATQVAARFLERAGKKMPYMSLLKLMYFTDREALLRWGAPVTDDRYFSLDHGPILSNVKNLIVEEHVDRGFWDHHISEPVHYMIELLDNAGNDELSPAEELLIDEIYATHGALDRWDLRKLSHDLPEWQDPHGSSIPIEIEDILAARFGEEERKAIASELKAIRKMQALMAD